MVVSATIVQDVEAFPQAKPMSFPHYLFVEKIAPSHSRLQTTALPFWPPVLLREGGPLV
jgi:hypothetical protein